MSNPNTLFLSSRSGQGMFWTNSTITDIPVVAAPRLASSGLGQLVPGDPYFPYAYLTGVYNAVQLVGYMQVGGTACTACMVHWGPSPHVGYSHV